MSRLVALLFIVLLASCGEPLLAPSGDDELDTSRVPFNTVSGEEDDEEEAEEEPELTPVEEEEEVVLELPEPDGAPPDGEEVEADAGVVTPPSEPPAQCVEYTLRHLQASMQHTDSDAQKKAAIDLAFVNADGVSADTISWTEIETQVQINRINNRAGWETYWPSGSPTVAAANAVPISWKTSVFTRISGSSHKASSGKAGVSPHRYVTRVRLRHLASGTDVARVAHHSVSGVDNPQNNVEYRLAAHAQNITKFNEVMLGANFPVIGSGDFNTVHLKKKLKAENGGVQPYVFDVPETGGSLGNRLIDWVVRRKSDGNAHELLGVRFVDLSPSDHKGVRTRFKYRPPPCQ